MWVYLACSKMDWRLASRRIWNDLLKFLPKLVQFTCHSKCSFYQVIKDTFIKLPFLWTALPKLLIIVIKAGPMLAKLGEAVFVDIFDSVIMILSAKIARVNNTSPMASATYWSGHRCGGTNRYPHLQWWKAAREYAHCTPVFHLHTFRASRNSPSLLQAFYLPLPSILSLALHEIIVVRFASCANKEARR